MGCGASAVPVLYAHIPNRYSCLEEVTDALAKAGLTESQLIIGIDFSKSNRDTGSRSFDGRSLHEVNARHPDTDRNPYQDAFRMIAEALSRFDADQLFPVYGFGDATTGNRYVFSFQPDDKPCHGLMAAVTRYIEVAQAVTLSGPSSFAPLIRQAILKCREAAAYTKPTFHVLLILADGQISASSKLDTENALDEASKYPLSIICIGVGDGPWDIMNKYDDKLRRRRFDNFQFVEYSTVFGMYPYLKYKDAFATHALQAVPSQYKACDLLGYLKNDWEMPENFKVPPKAFGPPDRPSIGDPQHGVAAGWTAVYHHALEQYFYMSKETGDALWEKPVLTLYKPPPPSHRSDSEHGSKKPRGKNRK